LSEENTFPVPFGFILGCTLFFIVILPSAVTTGIHF
jgi:hypothetical protein